jgi:Ca-activated chloride channel family protein
MEVLYQRGLAPLPTSERSTKLMKRLKEQFYWPLGAAILLLIIEILLPEQKGARRPGKPGVVKAPAQGAAATALLLFCFAMPALHASASKAQRHYKAGEYKSALSEYQELISRNPNDPRLHYNAGAAAYEAGKFDAAQKEFQSAAASRDLDLQAQSFYNLGNSEFRVGQGLSDPKERMASWEQAVQHYDAALKINPKDADAEFNRDLVRKKLEELKKQQQKQDKKENKQDQQKNQDNKDENKKKDSQDQKDNKSGKDQKQDKNQQQNQNKENNQQQQGGKKEDQEKKKEQQQSQAQKDNEKDKDKNSQAQAKPGGQKQSDQEKRDAEAAEAAQFAQLGKMTPAQAKQLLDAQRSEEKALLFIPPNQKSAAQNHSFKDW